MAYKLSKVDVWVTDLVNRPGMLARCLEAISNVGGNLEFVVARRVTERTARAFFAPLVGAKQQKAAADVGLQKAGGMHVLRIEGPDKPGLGARMTRAIADANINGRGLSSAAIAKKMVCYIAFGSDADLKHATKVLKKALK